MASEQVASGHIDIDLRDNATAALEKIEREFDRTIDKIDRSRATAHIDASVDEFDAAIKHARRELKILKAERATAKLDAEKKSLDKKIAAAKAEIEYLDGLKAVVEIDVQGERDAIAAARRVAAEKEAIEKAEERRRKKREAVLKAVEREQAARDRERMQGISRLSRHRAAMWNQQRREYEAAERAAYAEEAARNRAIEKIKREQQEVPRLQERYVQLARSIDDFDVKRRRVARQGDKTALLLVDLQYQKALTEMSAIKETLEERGSPVNLDVDVKPSRDLGIAVRKAFDERGGLAAAGVFGSLLGARAVQGFQKRFTPMRTAVSTVGNALARFGDKLADVAQGMSQVRLHLGIFNLSIRQLVVASAAFAPILVDIIGALGPLIGVLGSATLGFGALSAGLLGGAIPAFAGFLGVIVPVAKQFSDAMSAAEAYDDALLKYGKGSEQAKTKLGQLRKVLQGVDKETVENFREAGKLSDRWSKLTAPARAAAFEVIGDALGFASDNMTDFAARTNAGMNIASTGLRRWIDGLNSVEGRNILGNMMDNFNASLGPLLKGLGSIATYLGRVGSVASNFLPGFARQFRDWADGVADGAKNTDDLTRRVTETIDSLRAVGRFTLAGGRLLKAFFGAGVNEGQSFLQTMTNAMNRWTAFLNTARGRAALADFFENAVDGAQAFYRAVVPLIKIFLQWANAMSPVAEAFFNGIGAVGQFASALLSVTALRGPITALAATLGALWAVGKISAATSAVRGFVSALLGLKAAQTGLAVSSAAGGIAAGLGGGAAAAATTRNLTAMTAATTATGTAAAQAATKTGVLRAAVSSLGGTLAARVAMINPWTAALTAAAGGAVYLGAKIGEVHSRNEELSKTLYMGRTPLQEFGATVDDLGNSFSGLGDAISEGFSQTTVGKVVDFWKSAFGAATKTDVDPAFVAGLKKQAEEGAKALQKYDTAMQGVAQAHDMAKDSALQTEWAERQYQDAVKQFGKNSLEARTAHQNLQTARKEEARIAQQSARALDVAQKQSSKAIKKYEGVLKSAIAERRRLVEAGDIEKGDDTWKGMTKSINEMRGNLDIARASMINVSRATAGLAPIFKVSAKALGNLMSQLGEKQTIEIAMKFPDPNKAARVMRAVNRAISAGVNKKQAVNIVTNADSAIAAIRQLNRLRIKSLTMKIDTSDPQKTIKLLEEIRGKRLTPKQQRIVEQGGQQLLRLISRITGINLKTLVQIFKANDAPWKSLYNKVKSSTLPPLVQTATLSTGGWQSQFHALATASLPPLVQLVSLRKTRAAGGVATFADGGVSSFAAGGGTGATPDPNRLARAARQAEQSQTRDIRGGGRVNRPTYLTGEENRTEFIISTNPRYRERNIGLLRAAAASVLGGVSRNLLGTADDVESAGIISAASGFGKGGVYRPNPKLRKRRAVKGKRKSAKRKKKLGREWNRQIDHLFMQRDEWTREISIREAQVKEPEDFLMEGGPLLDANGQVVKDDDGKPIRALVPNEGAIAAYEAQLNAVKSAYDKLMEILRALVTSIPKAMESFRQERTVRRNRAERLRAEIRRLEDKASNSKLSKAKRGEARKEAGKKKKALRREEKVLSDINSDLGSLGEDRKDAGFTIREETIDRDDVVAELNSVRGRAAADAAEQNEQLRGSAGGGGGDASLNPSLSYGQQVAAADSEKASVLQQFGSNIRPVTGGGVPSPGGSGRSPGAIPGGGVGALGSGVTSGAFAATGAGLTGNATGAGVTSMHSAGAQAAGAQLAAAAGGFAPIGGGDNVKNVTVNNTFAAPPEDPHSWSAGVNYELGALI